MFFIMIRVNRRDTLFPYTTLFRSCAKGYRLRFSRRELPMIKMLDPKTFTVLVTGATAGFGAAMCRRFAGAGGKVRSEEHTSELQSRVDLVCRLLLEKKKKRKNVYS